MIVCVNTYNRVDYAKKTLAAIKESADFLGEPVKILVSVDYSEFQGEMSDLAGAALSGLDFSIIKHKTNKGCNRATYELLSEGFSYDDYVVFIEDDILLAKDALYYFKQVGEKARPYSNIFTVDAYNTGTFTKEDYKNVIISESFKPWGWATWKERWDDGGDDCPKNNWKYNLGLKIHKDKLYTDATWDCYMKKCVRKDRHRIYPKVPRCMNIGEVGTHTPSIDFHRRKHTVLFFSANLDLDLKIDYSIDLAGVLS